MSFRLSNTVRYLNTRYIRARVLRPRVLLPLAAFVGLVWFLSGTHDESHSAGGVLLSRQERYLRYQASEARRTGPGEKGAGVKLSPEEVVRYKEVNEKEGFNFAVSEKISLERSLPDHRSSA